MVDEFIPADVKGLVDDYRQWRDYNEYMVFRREDMKTGEVDFKAGLCSKRGNSIYNWKLFKRFDKLRLDDDDYEFFNYHDRSGGYKKTRALFLTLTYDRDISLEDAWDEVGDDWNRFITGLREKFGDLEYARVWEAQGDGYPHIHVVILFEDEDFDAFFYNGKWRVRGRWYVVQGWKYGFSDLQGCSSMDWGLDYLKKYLTKTHKTRCKRGEPITKGELGLALMWVFRKQAWAISYHYNDLITSYNNSKSRDVEGWYDLDGVFHKRYVWTLRGFWGGEIVKNKGVLWGTFMSLRVFDVLSSGESWSHNQYL